MLLFVAMWFVVVLLVVVNFMVVLDLSIVNVLVLNIVGGLGVLFGEGIWVIMLYVVVEVIIVLLIGWLISCFGLVCVLVVVMVGFGLCFVFCVFLISLNFLVVVWIF